MARSVSILAIRIAQKPAGVGGGLGGQDPHKDPACGAINGDEQVASGGFIRDLLARYLTSTWRYPGSQVLKVLRGAVGFLGRKALRLLTPWRRNEEGSENDPGDRFPADRKSVV